MPRTAPDARRAGPAVRAWRWLRRGLSIIEAGVVITLGLVSVAGGYALLWPAWESENVRRQVSEVVLVVEAGRALVHAGTDAPYEQLTAAVAAQLPERLRREARRRDYAHPRIAGATRVTLARAEPAPGTVDGTSRNLKATGPRHLIVRVGTTQDPLFEPLCRGLTQSSVPGLVGVQVVPNADLAVAPVEADEDPSDSVVPGDEEELYVRYPEAGTHSSLDDLATRAGEHCEDETVMLLAVQ